MGQLILPSAPLDLDTAVKAWSQPIILPTYRPLPADRNPMFLEKRVYQGSSGRIYPLPFIDRIAQDKTELAWDAVHIENQFLRLMILPQLGGRIHVGLDKTNGYDFFYRQDVIKPALVGLAGPWISGGVEFNWPQHHRPSTFKPVETEIERHADGSITVWCSEHEPMNRMKGMHGICLHPGRSVIELKARLYNRTELVQTFLWWANVATRVHERYQSFFPPDVHHLADHARRATSRFPVCDGQYYGIDYARRGREGVPASEMPRLFAPSQAYPANDLSWYANIPVPTSYMATGSRQDFFGGYDHAARAGIVHVANHHIAPGKKQWTWGNHEFGYAWDRNLTDADENGIFHPYIELMAGVFTDNQPDFSFLHPGETRTFSQFWYPIQQIGPPQAANVDAAVALTVRDGVARVGVATSGPLAARVSVISTAGSTLKEMDVDIAPDRPLVTTLPLPPGITAPTVRVTARDGGHIIIEYTPVEPAPKDAPPAATEPPRPKDIASIDELYLTGVHLEQYRHATRAPDAYWREALRRDPSDSRCNTAMGVWHLRRGDFLEAVTHLTKAVESLTRRNPNPSDGEAHYHLGVALRHLGRDDEAYDALYKATWNFAWQSPAFLALAELDCRRGQWSRALEHLDRALRVNLDHSKARNLRAIVLHKLGRASDAAQQVLETLRADPLDATARYLGGKNIPGDAQMYIDVAMDLAAAGLLGDAAEVLRVVPATDGAAPLVFYYRGRLLELLGHHAEAALERKEAASASPDYCFPARLEEIAVLRAAIAAQPNDALAPYLLGNLLYDRRRHYEAIALWEQSVRLDPSYSVCWRNLGVAYFNVRKDTNAARAAYDRALNANPRDARLLYERDQLWKRVGESPTRRLAELQRYPDLLRQRDDLLVELCALFNQTGAPEQAMTLLQRRRFQPWEGGEGSALCQHARSHLLLGRQALADKDAPVARRLFEAALSAPPNLGEANHLLANQSDIDYWIGVAADAAGDRVTAERRWTSAAEARGDFQEMSVRAFSESTYYSALSMRALGRVKEAKQLLRDLLAYGETLQRTPAKIDYFATSLPTMLLFDDDLQRRQTIHAKLLIAQAKLGLGEQDTASRWLQDILRDDPSHALAADLLASITAQTKSG